MMLTGKGHATQTSPWIIPPEWCYFCKSWIISWGGFTAADVSRSGSFWLLSVSKNLTHHRWFFFFLKKKRQKKKEHSKDPYTLLISMERELKWAEEQPAKIATLGLMFDGCRCRMWAMCGRFAWAHSTQLQWCQHLYFISLSLSLPTPPSPSYTHLNASIMGTIHSWMIMKYFFRLLNDRMN